MKRTISLILTFCLVFAVFAAFPFSKSIEASAYAAPVDINGNKKSSATFIIDPGHGGSDPGACLGSRKEAEDVLRLSLAVGRLIIQSGESVAFTRTYEFFNSPSEKAAAANSGSYKYFVSVHRNASGVGGVGYETYYYSGTTSKNLANAIHNKMVALNIWRNRGVKTAAYTVLTNTNMPAVLLEVGFIDVASENTIFDNNFDRMAEAIANGMLSMVGKSVSNNSVTKPSVTVNSVVDHGQSLSVSWGKVTNATSYKYSATLYQGEMSATSGTSIVSTTTTGTSFTIPAQSSGKYIKISVTAVGPSNSATTNVTVMVGPYCAAPQGVQYIPIEEIDGNQWGTGSTIWTSANSTAFQAVYWRAFLCSANSDGTYKVKTVYEYNQGSKSITVSGTDILFAFHCDSTNFAYTADIAVGDVFTLCGVYIDNKTIRGVGYILVNGGKPLHPTTLTLPETADVSLEKNLVKGATVGTTGSAVVSMFNEDSEYIEVRNTSGAVVTDAAVGTGYTVNLVVDNVVTISYTIVVNGDINGDADITSSDLLSSGMAVKSSVTLKDAFLSAADINGSGEVDASDYLSVATMIN